MDSRYSIERYMPLYHGTSAILKPGDLLYPRAGNVKKINAVWGTSYYPKAVACALLSKHNMQNICAARGNYSYLYDSRCRSLILYPDWNWDDNIPVFVYELDKISFYKYFSNGPRNEYVSPGPAKVIRKDTISKNSFERNGIKLFVADNITIFNSLHRLYENAEYIGNSIIEKVCQRIV